MTLKPWIEYDKRVKRYVVRWRDSNGKKCRDTFTWDTRQEAKKRLEVLVLQNRNNALGYSRELPFDEAIEIFMRLHGPHLSNDQTRRNYISQLWQLKIAFGMKTLNQITFQDIATYWDEQTVIGLKRTTVRRRVSMIHNMYERFKFWNGMVPSVMPEKVALPDLNPAAVAMEYLGNRKTSTYGLNRKRRVSEEELSTAKAWCAMNDAGLWKGIELAIWTALRKSDQKKVKANESVNMTQEKTQRSQVMPIVLKEVPELGDLSWRWDILRGAMGWFKAPKGLPDNPKHTTWHDLRHCAPSWLADEGFSEQVIAQYLGQASEKMSRTYTHPSGSALIPAVRFVERKLEAL